MGDRARPAFRDHHRRRAVPFHKAVRCARRAHWKCWAIGHLSHRRDGPAALLPPGVDGMAVGAGDLRAVPHAQLTEQRGHHASPGLDATTSRLAVCARALSGDDMSNAKSISGGFTAAAICSNYSNAAEDTSSEVRAQSATKSRGSYGRAVQLYAPRTSPASSRSRPPISPVATGNPRAAHGRSLRQWSRSRSSASSAALTASRRR